MRLKNKFAFFHMCLDFDQNLSENYQCFSGNVSGWILIKICLRDDFSSENLFGFLPKIISTEKLSFFRICLQNLNISPENLSEK